MNAPDGRFDTAGRGGVDVSTAEPSPVRPVPRLMRRPGLTIGVGLAIAVVGVIGLVLNMMAPTHFDSRPGEFLLLLGVPIDALVGVYLVRRRPKHPLGHLMVLLAFGLGIDSPAKAVLNLEIGGYDGTLMRWALWVDNTTWSLTYLAVALILLLYPNGAPVNRFFHRIVQAAVVFGLLLFATCALAPNSPDSDYPGVTTPAASGVPVGLVKDLYSVWFIAIVACIAVGVVGLFVRGLRARRVGDPVVRAQVRWLAWAAVVAIVMVVSQAWIDPLVGQWVPWLGNVVSELGPYALVVALVVAVTRHGLFEIDRVVSRTVGYVVVTGLLLGVYVGIIAGLSGLLPTNANSFVVAAATLVVAAGFIPFRRTVQRRVDRRFNRQRHNRDLLVARYADAVRRAVDHGTSGTDLVAVVNRALEPSHAGLWLVSR